jgi:hypothetical protein
VAWNIFAARRLCIPISRERGGAEMPEALLPIWMIEPNAPADDQAWQGRYIWRKILVREENDAFARLAAEKWVIEHSSGKLAEDARTGLTNVKLYKTTHLPIKADEMLEYAGVERGVLDVEH